MQQTRIPRVRYGNRAAINQVNAECIIIEVNVFYAFTGSEFPNQSFQASKSSC